MPRRAVQNMVSVPNDSTNVLQTCRRLSVHSCPFVKPCPTVRSDLPFAAERAVRSKAFSLAHVLDASALCLRCFFAESLRRLAFGAERLALAAGVFGFFLGLSCSTPFPPHTSMTPGISHLQGQRRRYRDTYPPPIFPSTDVDINNAGYSRLTSPMYVVRGCAFVIGPRKKVMIEKKSDDSEMYQKRGIHSAKCVHHRGRSGH